MLAAMATVWGSAEGIIHARSYPTRREARLLPRGEGGIRGLATWS